MSFIVPLCLSEYRLLYSTFHWKLQSQFAYKTTQNDYHNVYNDPISVYIICVPQHPRNPFTHTRNHTHAHTSTYTHTDAQTHTHTYTHAHARTHTRAHEHTHRHTHTHTHTHLHTRARTYTKPWSQCLQVSSLNLHVYQSIHTSWKEWLQCWPLKL